MKRTFVIEMGNLDRAGNRIDVSGIRFKKKTLLTKEFNHTKPLGYANVFKEDGVLKAEADIPDELLNLYPAIGFSMKQISINDQGITDIHKFELHEVSLCVNQNADPNIKRIIEQ